MSARARLLARGHRGMSLGLERTLTALGELGSPHLGLPVFHVAGTNGKGSVSAMLERALREGGLRTGLYTSPHLSRFVERVQVDGAPVSDAALDAALDRVFRDAHDQLTFFETLTLAAFVLFREAGLDAVVLEVGLGGRLDSTNVIEDPIASAVVSIAEGDDGRHLEHANLLGDTVAAIAREKAGVAKRGRPLVLGAVSPVARDTISEVAHEVGANLVDVGAQTGPELVLDDARVRLTPRLPGPHQLHNARVAAALAVVGRDRVAISDEAVARGIALAEWPARLEWIAYRGRRFLLDAAHNLDGARALRDAAAALAIDPARTLLLFGALADKPYREVLTLLAPLARSRVYAEPQGRAPAPLGELAQVAPGAATANAAEAVERAVRDSAPDEVILVAGSIYLVGAVRAHLLGIEQDPVVGL